MCKYKFALLLVLLCLSQIARSLGDPAEGKHKANMCIECHGVDGISPDPNIPKLSGQIANFIVTEITEFQEGTRQNKHMSKVSKMIKNTQDLEDIAAYFATRPMMKGQLTGSQPTSDGEELLTRARCNYCHREGGKLYSPFTAYPPPPLIGGQHKAYLIKAMKDIRDGDRPADAYGLMMDDLNQLSDIQIDSIAEYLNGL
jgi:cytochrome c553